MLFGRLICVYKFFFLDLYIYIILVTIPNVWQHVEVLNYVGPPLTADCGTT